MLENNPKPVSNNTTNNVQKTDGEPADKTQKKQPNTGKDFKELMSKKKQSTPASPFPGPHVLMAKSLEDEIVIKDTKEVFKEGLGGVVTDSSLKGAPSFNTITSVVQTPHSPDFKALVEQLTDQLYIMRNAGQTETTLTIRHPPLFAGATITITEFNTAPREVNLTFENLRPEARELIDKQGTLLKDNLKDTGYTVHVLRTTEQTRETLASMEERFRQFQDNTGSRQQKREEAEQEDAEEDKKV